MSVILNTIMIYAKDIHRTADFYKKHFEFKTTGDVVEGLIELESKENGSTILIHQAAKGVKLGQATVKLVFSVKNLEAFKTKSAKNGLIFGSTHQANGYQFANSKDPDKNSVSISSREYRKNA